MIATPNARWPKRQMHERREHDHRPADRPDHLQRADEAEIEVEPDEHVQHDDLEEDQPEAAREEKERQLAAVLPRIVCR